jgi:hypothetical protein
MPPRDLYDINPVYNNIFFTAYCDFLVGHPILEVDPLQQIEVSMLTEEEFEELFVMDDDESLETEMEEIHDGTTDYDSDSDMSDSEREWVHQNQEWVNHNTYGGQVYMDVMIAMGWYPNNFPGVGTVDDPIDMTGDQ